VTVCRNVLFSVTYMRYNCLLACCDAIIGWNCTSCNMLWYYIKSEGMEAKYIEKYLCLVLAGKSWHSIKL